MFEPSAFSVINASPLTGKNAWSLPVFDSVTCRRGLTDEFGVEAMMMEALEKVEKEIKKPLMRNDKKGMAILMAEFDKINKK